MTQDQPKKWPQQYDTTFKNWIASQAPDILPLLLAGVEYERALDVEMLLPTMRADKVFQVLYHGREHILHLEFESGSDTKLPSRLLVYNAVLYHKHQLPVITIVIYPFSVKMAEPPLVVADGGQEEIHRFRFQTLPLFDLDAATYVEHHRTCMYPLIPTMLGVHAGLIDQVIQELTELYHDDEGTLGEQLVWMKVLLERTDTVPSLEKGKIKERLTMFDELFEKSPMIQKMREESRVQGLQEALVNVVRAKYPDLAEFAQLQASHFDKPDVLDLLIQRVVTAPNASTARWLLESGTGM